MKISNMIIEQIQSVYFDLCDLLEKLDCRAIELEDFEEFDNLQEFIIEQKQKMADLEHSLTGE
jgi:hypothetical protein